MSSPEKQAWEQFYRAGEGIMRWPSECVIRFVARFKSARKGAAGSWAGRALDLGCGVGRHVWLLAREGLDPAGVDISSVAVAQANRVLQAEGFAPSAVTFDGRTLPFDEDSFDLVLSYGVLDSIEPASAERLMAETVRVLRPGGHVLATLRGSADTDYMRIGTQIAHNTVRVDTEFEHDTVQHFFDYDEVIALMAPLKDILISREDRIDWSTSGRMFSRWNATGVLG